MTQNPERDYDMRREAEAEPSDALALQRSARSSAGRSPSNAPRAESLIGETRAALSKATYATSTLRRNKLKKMIGGYE